MHRRPHEKVCNLECKTDAKNVDKILPEADRGGSSAVSRTMMSQSTVPHHVPLSSNKALVTLLVVQITQG